MDRPAAASSSPSNATTSNGGNTPSGSLKRSLSNSGLGRARQRVTSLTSTLRNSIIMTEKDDAQSVKTTTSTVAPSVAPSKKGFRPSLRARFSRSNKAVPIEPLQDEKPLGTLRIQILGCKELPAADSNGKSDPYVVVTFSRQRHKTPVIKSTLAPRYEAKTASFDFVVYASVMEKVGSLLELVVWDKDLIGKDYLGERCLPAAEWFDLAGTSKVFETKENKDFWLPLVSSRERRTAKGQINLKIGFLANTVANADAAYSNILLQSRGGHGALMAAPPDQGIGTLGAGEFGVANFDGDSDDEEGTGTRSSYYGSSPTDASSLGRSHSRRYSSGTYTSVSDTLPRVPSPSAPPKPLPLVRTPTTRKNLPSFRLNWAGTKIDYSFSGHRDVAGIVLLEVQRAAHLPKSAGGGIGRLAGQSWDMDPFVVVTFGRKTFRTRVIRHNLNPDWNEKIMFHVRKSDLEGGPEAGKISLSVLDWDKFASDDLVGETSVPVGDLISRAPPPNAATGLYAEDANLGHGMAELALSLVVGKDTKIEDKSKPPCLHVSAKYEPHASFRQRFWRGSLHAFDKDKNGTFGFAEITAFLEDLGLALETASVYGFWKEHGKDPLTQELTLDETVQSLEQAIGTALEKGERPHWATEGKPEVKAEEPKAEDREDSGSYDEHLLESGQDSMIGSMIGSGFGGSGVVVPEPKAETEAVVDSPVAETKQEVAESPLAKVKEEIEVDGALVEDDNDSLPDSIEGAHKDTLGDSIINVPAASQVVETPAVPVESTSVPAAVTEMKPVADEDDYGSAPEDALADSMISVPDDMEDSIISMPEELEPVAVPPPAVVETAPVPESETTREPQLETVQESSQESALEPEPVTVAEPATTETPAAATTETPETATEPEAAPEQQLETAPESEEVEPATTETEPEVAKVPESIPEPQPETETVPQPPTETESVQEPQLETAPASEPEAVEPATTETEPEASKVPESAPEPQPEIESAPEPHPETVYASEPEVAEPATKETESEAAMAPESAPEPQPATVLETGEESESEPEPATVPVTAPELQPETVPDAAQASEPETAPEPKVETVRELEAVAVPEPVTLETEPEVEKEAEPETQKEAEPKVEAEKESAPSTDVDTPPESPVSDPKTPQPETPTTNLPATTPAMDATPSSPPLPAPIARPPPTEPRSSTYGRNRESLADIEGELFALFDEHPDADHTNPDKPQVPGRALVTILADFELAHGGMKLLDEEELGKLNALLDANPGITVDSDLLLAFIAQRTAHHQAPADGQSKVFDDDEREVEGYLIQDDGDLTERVPPGGFGSTNGNGRGTKSRSSSRSTTRGESPDGRAPREPKTPLRSDAFHSRQRSTPIVPAPTSWKPKSTYRRRSSVGSQGRPSGFVSDGETSENEHGRQQRRRAPSTGPTSPSPANAGYGRQSRPHSRSSGIDDSGVLVPRADEFDSNEPTTDVFTPAATASSDSDPESDEEDEDEDEHLVRPRDSVVSMLGLEVQQPYEKLEELQKTNADLLRKIQDSERALQSKVMEHESELEELQNRLDELQEELQNSKHNEKDLRIKERGTQSQVQTLETEVSKLQKQLEASRTSYQSLQRQYQEQCAESEKYRMLLRRKDHDLKEAEENAQAHHSEMNKWKSAHDIAEASIQQLEKELAATRAAQLSLDEQKQENAMLKETIDRLRFDLDDLRLTKTQQSQGSSRPGSMFNSLDPSMSRTLANEIKRQFAEKENEKEEEETEEPERESEDDEFVETIIKRRKKVARKAHPGSIPAIEEDVKEYADEGTQHGPADYTSSAGQQTDAPPSPPARASCSIQTDEVPAPEPVIVEKIVEVQVPAAAPSPPPYEALTEAERTRIGDEVVHRWHPGLSSANVLGITRDAVRDWANLKREIGFECAAIDKVVETAPITGDRPGATVEPLEIREAEAEDEDEMRLFKKLTKRFRERIERSDWLVTGALVAMCAFGGVWLVSLMASGILHTVYPHYGVPSYVDRWYWTTYNTLGVPSIEGMPSRTGFIHGTIDNFWRLVGKVLPLSGTRAAIVPT